MLPHAPQTSVLVRASRACGRACGFTLVELVVAMLLLAVVLALTTRFLLGGFANSNRAISHQDTIQQSRAAMELLGADIRRMRAHDRDLNIVGDRYRLREIVLFNTSSLSPIPDVEDIVTAGDNTLVFQADVAPDPPTATGVVTHRPECVTWQATTAGTTWRLQRTVSTYSYRCSSTAAGSVETVIGPVTAPAAMLPTPVFRSYTMHGNPANIATVAAVNPDACSSWQTTPTDASVLSRMRRNQVAAIELDLRSLVPGKDRNVTEGLRDRFGVRSRSAYGYLFALGCSR